MALDLAVIGTGLGVVITNAIAYYIGNGKGKRASEGAAFAAEGELYTTLRKEIAALHDEIVRLRRYVGRLERAVRDGGLELPALDEPAGGTD